MTSPLAEASPESLQELFDKDPLQLTSDDIERIVTELRAQRERWKAAEATGAHKRVKKEVVKLDLADLGL
jgi:predicted DNA-binding transcriptional regulator YafY